MSKLTLKNLEEKIVELQSRVDELESKFDNRRGPKSSRQMTEDDAKRIMLGDLKNATHKDCAKELELSYGQVYSARGGFTFKTVYKEMTEKAKKTKDAKKVAETSK